MNSVDASALWHAIFDAYPDAVLVVDADGRIARANHAASALLGYSLDELTRLTVEALVPEAARGRHVADRQGFQHSPRSRPMGTQMDLAARRRDGSEVLVEIALSPLQVEGKSFVLAAIRGVGEYPRVKQALRRARHAECIARMGHMAVDSADAQAMLAEVPAAAAAALDAQVGILHVLEPDGRQVRSYGHRPLRPATAADLASARAGVGASSLPGFATMLVAPLAERGRVLGVIEIHTREPHAFDTDDQRCIASLASLLATVVQRGASEAQLRHAQRLESVGQLTGGIAHDFNNLLTVVQGNLQVLDDWPSVAADEGARDLVAAAMRASRRGAELTSKLLAFSRRQMLQPKRVDLAQFVPPLAELLRRTLDARIHIEVAIEPETPACRADPGQLESALVNIAINARDAMPDGGTLSFRARRCDEAPVAVDREAWRGGGVALSVADTGTGMSEAVLARAFEPFFTTKEAGRGTGLGLATVYGFAHQSRGGVALDSRPGQGTTVTLYLPSADEPVSTVAAAPERGAVALPTGLSVLLVEDEPEVLRVVQTFLTGWGCQVLACSRAEAALEALRPGGTPFDLLLSDVVLGPGVRGTDIAERARALRPGLSVLLMSGYAPDAAAPADGGAWPLLRKPFTREQLAQAIAALL
jgi:PAS domain S-box-containing protein